MSHSELLTPELTSAYVYNKKTYADKKEAVWAEANDRVKECLKGSINNGGYYWDYCAPAIQANQDEFLEIMEWVSKENRVAEQAQEAAVHNVDNGWNW